LLDEGIDYKYGARHLKRAIERFLVYPISNLVATGQVITGDLVVIDFDPVSSKLVFTKEEGGALVGPTGEKYREMFAESGSQKAAAAGANDAGAKTAPLKVIEK
ncbi:MAG TPA: ATP-dependent Clp protease ATP-binding subunit, partial [Blastocatellia bacterium]